jgi:LuxR family maltose regulon positive regulatory protein
MVVLANHCPGPWICVVGSARKGAPEDYINALTRTVAYQSQHLNGRLAGEDDLARGELKFYKSDINGAEPLVAHALKKAQEKRQFEIEQRALFYTLRIAVLKGNYAKAEQTLQEMKAQLDEPEYMNRFTNYDIALAWYYCYVGLPEKTPHWLTENFSSYGHAAFIENFANQIKARFCYITRSYPLLCSYIEEMKQRESFLFGRVEMLAMEACVHYKMKDTEKAFATLLEAYQTALPNGLLMPFIELGKDMRTLANFALKETKGGIPKPWLESIHRKAASYAKCHAHIVAEYKRAKGIVNSVVFSPRETDILTDLSHGLSRAEIAESRSLSINTVKMVINNIYLKLGAENLPDLIRIAVERKII